MKKYIKRTGFTFTPAVFIILILMIATATFLIYVINSGKSQIKVENSTIAKYVAESGIFQLKAKLAKMTVVDSSGKVTNKWYNAKTFKYDANPTGNPTCADYIFTSAHCSDGVRTPTNTSKESNLIELKEDPFNSASKVIGKYRITIDDGALTSGKTSTGSVVAGNDRYNNKIWSDSTNKNYFSKTGMTRYGIKVDGYATVSGVDVKPAQSIYGVLDIPQNTKTILPEDWGGGTVKAPSSYMLSTNGLTNTLSAPVATDKLLNLLSNQVITGPIHTNEQFGFTFKGNFDIFEPTGEKRPSKNDYFTVVTQRQNTPNTGDYDPLLAYQFSFFDVANPRRMTVFGVGFPVANTSLYYSLQYNDSSGNPHMVAWKNPFKSGICSGIDPTPFSGGDRNASRVAGDNYMEIDLPSDITTPFKLSVGRSDQSLTWLVSNEDIINDIPKEKLDVMGIMQVSQKGLITERVYDQNHNELNGEKDYRFISSLYTHGAGIPSYIAWDPPGNEPAGASTYYTTYITNYNPPHNKIKVYSPLTYANSSSSFSKPKLYYIHSHKAPNKTTAKWVMSHEHRGNVFGLASVDMLMNNAGTDYIYTPLQAVTYDWTFYHRHEMSSELLDLNHPTATYYKDTFFTWGDAGVTFGYKPSVSASKIAPVLVPNNVNFNTQRIYFSQVLKSITGRELSVDASGNFQNPDQINEDRDNGYYDAKDGIIDFRATYFGNDLKYTAGDFVGADVLPAGSKISDTKIIYVNDKQYLNDNTKTPNPNYMKIANNQVNSDYKTYTYRQIPKNSSIIVPGLKTPVEGGIILVREGVVRIGGKNYKTNGGSVRGDGYVSSAVNVGRNTIIDGRLTIISYSEKKPSPYVNEDTNSNTDNNGDIVITGNIIYKNKIYKYKDEISSPKYTHDGFRQYPAWVQNKYDPTGQTANIPNSISDSNIKWITDANSVPVDNDIMPCTKGPCEDGNEIKEKVDALALVSSNDIKIPVMHYYQIDTNGDEDKYDPTNAKQDVLTIHGQLLAGHQITQTKSKISPGFPLSPIVVPSKNDQLIMFGSFYSYEQPDLSYFNRTPVDKFEYSLGRIYMFDKGLSQVPLPAVPYFPISSTNPYDPANQFIPGSNMPRIVPGTWKNVSDGKQ